MWIKTERLILKPFAEEDLAEILRLLTNDTVKATYLVPDFKSEDEGWKMAHRFRELSAFGDRCVAGIYLEDALIGFLNDVEIGDGYMEMGYVIAPEYHGKGYATEAFRAVIAYLFEKGYREVWASAFESNLASIRVMEKCGMTRMKKRAEIEYRGKRHRCIYYAIQKKTDSF